MSDRYIVMTADSVALAESDGQLRFNGSYTDLDTASAEAGDRAAKTTKPMCVLKVSPVALYRTTVQVDVTTPDP